jgi:anti-anti-sigma factor
MLSRHVSGDHAIPSLPYFRLDLREEPGTSSVEVLLAGDLDRRTTGHLSDGLRWVVDRSDRPHLVVDVAEVTRMESTAAEVLLRVRDELAGERRSLTVRGHSGTVRSLLRLSGLLDVSSGGGTGRGA